jgi:hypothetical protein
MRNTYFRRSRSIGELSWKNAPDRIADDERNAAICAAHGIRPIRIGERQWLPYVVGRKWDDDDT